MQQLLSSYGGASLLPVPDTTGQILCLSTFGITAGWQNSSPLIHAYGDDNDTDIVSTAVNPFPLDWASIIPAVGANPVIFPWYDQSGNARDATATGVPDAPLIDESAKDFIFTVAGTESLDVADMGTIGNKMTLIAVLKSSNLATLNCFFQLRPDFDFLAAESTFALYQTSAGVLSVLQKDDTGVFFNGQIKTLADTNYHILYVEMDRTAATGSQTQCWLDNSTTGFANIGGNADMASTDLSADRALGIGYGQPLGSTAYANARMMHLQIFNDALGTTRRNEWYNFLAQAEVYGQFL